LRGYCEHHGIPRALYTDFDSVYDADKTLTDVGRAMQTLGVEIIYASSPQAKGRVEMSKIEKYCYNSLNYDVPNRDGETRQIA